MELSLPSVERQKRVLRALANPVYFGELYVRPYDSNWVEALPPFASEMMRFAVSKRRGVIILPPEFLKTTLVSQVYPLWLTYKYTVTGKLLRGLLMSEEEGMATNNLSVLSWHILNNELLAADFSDDRGRPLVFPDPEEDIWRDDAIVVRRYGTSKDPTWQAKGMAGGGIQGRRLDYLIGDDVITPANAFSPAKREKALRDWDMQITTRLVDSGRAIIAGNFNDPHDLVSTLASRGTYEVFKRPASHEPGNPAKALDPQDARAELLWPSNWSRERLLREKEEKPRTFGRIFLLDATAETGTALRTEWVRLIREEETPLNYARFFIGLDAAPGGEGDDLDFFNISVGALHERGLDLVESFDFRGTAAQQVEMVGLMHDNWDRLGQGVQAVGGAKIALDRYFTGALSIKRPDLDGKVVPISVVDASKEQRLEALGPYAKTGWLRVWEPVWDQRTSDPDDRWQELSLHDQWREFPHSRHDDKLDGLDILVRVSREFSLLRNVELELEALVSD